MEFVAAGNPRGVFGKCATKNKQVATSSLAFKSIESFEMCVIIIVYYARRQHHTIKIYSKRLKV